jgi:glycosyltransferase involved in cell wall biosynthesis
LFWLYPFLVIRNSVGTRIPFKLRDFLTCLFFVLFSGKKYNLFIGLESINALAGVILKNLGLVETVVYYVSDFSPSRYKAGWFNAIYLRLDQWAASQSDYIWDVSQAMMPARIKSGLNKKHASKLIHVPNAMFPAQIDYLPQSKIIPNSLMFAGTLGPENGPDLAIETLGLLKNSFPDMKLHIYGGGDSDLDRLRKLTSDLRLDDRVVFHGFFTDQVKLSKEIRQYALGLAPYMAIPGSPRWWADATKTRLYLAAGLPVVTTQVPPLGKEITADGAGVVADDNAKDQANAIKKILKNKEAYKKMRENAIKKAKSNTWESTYSNALKEMGYVA